MVYWESLQFCRLRNQNKPTQNKIYFVKQDSWDNSYENLKKVLHILNIKLQFQSPLISKKDATIHTQNLNRVKNKMKNKMRSKMEKTK